MKQLQSIPLHYTFKIYSSDALLNFIKNKQKLLAKKIDCLVLGCTHYPFLIPQIKKITGSSVEIIDSGLAVARQTKAILQKNNCLYTTKTIPEHHIYSNTNVATIKSLLANELHHTELHLKKF